MINHKAAFILYFDNMDLACQLPDEQLATLFRAIIYCAKQEGEGRDGISDIRERWPQMAPETWMTFQFIAGNLRRDAVKWLEKQARYQEGARKRLGRAAQYRVSVPDDIPEFR